MNTFIKKLAVLMYLWVTLSFALLIVFTPSMVHGADCNIDLTFQTVNGNIESNVRGEVKVKLKPGDAYSLNYQMGYCTPGGSTWGAVITEKIDGNVRELKKLGFNLKGNIPLSYSLPQGASEKIVIFTMTLQENGSNIVPPEVITIKFVPDDSGGTPGDPPAPTQETVTFSDIKVTDIKKDSVTISWTTNVKTNSEVVYGEQSQALDSANNKPFFKNAGANASFDLLPHSLKITGLKVATQYHFVVRGSPNKNTASTVGGEQAFLTAKADGTGGKDLGGSAGGDEDDTGSGGNQYPGGHGNESNVEKIKNPIASQSFIGVAFKVMKYLLGSIAGLAVVFIMIGAFQLMISQGNPEAVTRGKETILWAVVGLAIALFSFSIVAIFENILATFFK